LNDVSATHFGIEFERRPAPLPLWRARVDDAQWRALANAVRDAGGRLVSMWGLERSGASAELLACAAYAVPQGLLQVELPVSIVERTCPDIGDVFPCAGRMQRAARDLSGLRADGQVDQRPWLDHGLWAEGFTPLQPGTQPAAPRTVLPADYPFVRVEGDGVHEIAVGPVHAGVIEPGHFRFAVVGEKVLRLEEHLGYAHKGIERRFTEIAPLAAHRLAGRVSGDSTVAFAWAWCMALESALGCEIPARAAWMRALLLERERVANHLGDLGALGNDAAFSFGLAQFSRLREDWLRLSHEAFAHRLMMDVIVPGGVDADLPLGISDRMRWHCDEVEREVGTLRRIYDEHAGLQDRFLTTGQVSAQLAAQLGLTGLAGRASAQRSDLRCDHAWTPYRELAATMATHANGDVAARVAVRFDEVLESLRLIRDICRRLPASVDGTCARPAAPRAACSGAGWVEGWRGEVFVALDIDESGRIARCHCHDPSWQNWPVLEHAVIGNIVPDFPLINKSFNLSYSGHDL
jgi:Ni,Fe-hydrogenase III large subunit/Ni,Fe-hydrogenase III component G